MTGIITAMNCEAAYLESVMKDTAKKKIGAWEFTTGKIGSTQLVLAVCGIGKVFAGSCAQTMITSFGCTHIFNVGVAGSLDPKVKIGDIVCATAAVQHDMDTSAIGDPIGLISGIDLVELPCDEAFAAEFEQFLAGQGKALCKGIIATGDKFIKLGADKKFIADTFGACACEMEGGAVAQICCANGVKCSVIRIITDNADESSGEQYTVNLDECAVSLADLFAKYLTSRG